MKKSVFPYVHRLVLLSLLGLIGCYSTVEVGDGPVDKAIAIDWVDPLCAEPLEAGYIEGTGFGAENVTITVGGIVAEVIAATGMDASFIVPEKLLPGAIKVVVENPGGRLATIGWSVCEIECDPVDCDDGNECTTDTCDTSDGTCINDPVAGGTLCGTDGVCEAGACRERSWGTALVIPTGGVFSSAAAPWLDVDADGNVTVVFIGLHIDSPERGSAGSIRYTPDGGWGTAALISGSFTEPIRSGQANVAVDANGNATAVWSQDPYPGAIRPVAISNRYTPSAGWGMAVTISSELPIWDNGVPAMAVDPGGNVTVVWGQSALVGNGRAIWSNRYTPSGGWEGEGPVSNSTLNPTDPAVAVDANGNAMAVWRLGVADNDIWSARYTPSGGWGPTVPVERGNATGNASRADVVLDGDGNATAAWVEFPAGVWSARYTPSGGWGPTVPVEPTMGSANDVMLGVDRDGNVTAVYRAAAYPGVTATWSNRYTPGGGWGPTVLIDADSDGGGSRPQVAVDPDGNATALFMRTNAPLPGYSVWSNRYTPNVGWGTALSLGEGGLHKAITVDPDGKVTAVWTRQVGSSWEIWSNRFE